MEMQCKERIDLLEALRDSREEAKGSNTKSTANVISRRTSQPRTPTTYTDREKLGWIGDGTIPAVDYPQIARPGPPLPYRPQVSRERSIDTQSSQYPSLAPQYIQSTLPSKWSPPTLPASTKKSRTPSPEKRSRMLTTLRPPKDGKRPSRSSRATSERRTEPPAASKAAGLAWDSISRSSGARLAQSLAGQNSSSVTLNENNGTRKDSLTAHVEPSTARSSSAIGQQSSSDTISRYDKPHPSSSHAQGPQKNESPDVMDYRVQNFDSPINFEPIKAFTAQPEMTEAKTHHNIDKPLTRPQVPKADYPSYRNEYSTSLASSSKVSANPTTTKLDNIEAGTASTADFRHRSPTRQARQLPPFSVSRRPVANMTSPRSHYPTKSGVGSNGSGSSESADEHISSSQVPIKDVKRRAQKKKTEPMLANPAATPSSTDGESAEPSPRSKDFRERIKYIKKHLPKGVDEGAAKQIFNEIVVQGDEVHWSDVAGLEPAKKALKEAVVYPFLRPDLFMGLREPAKGMLLFGPPGTGKTMLARAVATESKSTFFAISASSLTSKWLGESEKLVRALFALAKALAPSIIFVDEIDSLLSSRGGSSEHESTRRVKTEFLIQWSDLQRAAAGKEQTDQEKREGDASRVLVLAATNCPWAIDEAARRRFVRRQYIPLPEDHVRAEQLKTLLSHQKHNLNDQDLEVLVQLTGGEFMLLFLYSDYS